MLVLSYAWLLALVPILVEKQDREVKWHAKHGLVILGAETAAWLVYFILTMIPGVGCVVIIAAPFMFLVSVVLRLIAIVKAIGGQRLIIPGLSVYADRF